jgi:hypothetical protein
MSERVFYPDTNDVSSTSKVVALSIARNRTREMIFRFTLSCHAIALASAEAFTNGGSSARQSWPNSYFLINTFYFGLFLRCFFGYKKR